jgi:hypothetical protein
MVSGPPSPLIEMEGSENFAEIFFSKKSREFFFWRK